MNNNSGVIWAQPAVWATLQMSYCCVLWSLLAFALPVLCSQLLPSVQITAAGPARSVAGPLVFQVTPIIVQIWEKPRVDITTAYTSPSNSHHCPGTRRGEHKTKLRIISLFPAYTRNRSSSAVPVWNCVFTHLRTQFSSWQNVPTKHVVILSKIIVLLWKRVFFCAVLLLPLVF